MREDSDVRVRSILVLLLTLAATLPSGSARAFDGPGCGTTLLKPTYRLTANCQFALRGSPLIIQGDSDDSVQPENDSRYPGIHARVHVRVTVDGYPDLVLLECEETGPHFADCEKGLPDDTTNLNLPPQVSTVYLRCTVTGTGVGKYWCQSGSA